MSERVTFDELYRRSTQYRKWSFTKDGLQQRRRSINQKGLDRVEKVLNETPEVDSSQIERVTVDEEQKLISFHSRRIIMLAKYFNMPSQVRATAISFLRKFYLVNSVMEYHPKLVLLTCLFLAAKSENFFISIASFSKRIPKTTPESILSLEFEILQSLQFTLFVHHPFRPLYGFFFDIQEVLKGEISVKELGKIYDGARNLINDALISDAVYYYTPPQIALACLKQIDEGVTLKYLRKKFGQSDVKKEKVEIKEVKEEDQEMKDETPQEKKIENHLEQLIKVITDCHQVISTAQDPTKEEATIIDKKVQYCLNPSLLLKRKREGETPESQDPNKRQRTESVEPSSTTPATN
ncbi:Cyclin CCL1 [Wickerhamomyces ciferrii]|uniref:Cyclin CCL1 n=1 Tax=Wickerhamomyces ciferrii (strain ATCC 14091 / BCRC 22168 / CBS 111 / JCM 3599 / NBRC 0793 / NRRL Y-1031 F-60-10) TaxID=1206466 RepID=K0KNJ4_WICCF|nr:Cyclin CCL1 [Wickerhamomyces ciferrii]CCH44566.1 Cyclin CCL1 [Wickerhamomyces ciferrii]